jgi:hypothetical protein
LNRLGFSELEVELIGHIYEVDGVLPDDVNETVCGRMELLFRGPDGKNAYGQLSAELTQPPDVTPSS